MSKLQLSLSHLAKGVGHVNNEENEKLDVIFEEDDYYNLKLENKYSTKEYLQNNYDAIKNENKLIPVHKTFITRKGALILFSEDLALKENWKNNSKIKPVRLKEIDYRGIYQNFSSDGFHLINTCNDLSTEILKYGNTPEYLQKGEKIFLRFVHPLKTKNVLFRPGFSPKQYMSAWCSLYNDFTDCFIKKGHVTDKLLYARKSSSNLTNNCLSSKPQPYKILPKILESKRSSFKNDLRSSSSVKTSINIENKEILSDEIIKALKYEENGQFCYVDYEKLNPSEKENILAELLVAAHEFQDKIISDLHFKRNASNKNSSKDEIVIDMRQAIKNLVSSPLKDQVLQSTVDLVSEKKEFLKDESILKERGNIISDEELMKNYLAEKESVDKKTAIVNGRKIPIANNAKKPIVFNMQLCLNEKYKRYPTQLHETKRNSAFPNTSNFVRNSLPENMFEKSATFNSYETGARIMDEKMAHLSIKHMPKYSSSIKQNTQTIPLYSTSETFNQISDNVSVKLNVEDENNKASDHYNDNTRTNYSNTRPCDRKSVEFKSTENVITSKMILSKMSQTRNQGLRTKLIPVQADTCEFYLDIPFNGMRGGKINSHFPYKSHLDQFKKIKTPTKYVKDEKTKHASICLPDGEVLPIGRSIKYYGSKRVIETEEFTEDFLKSKSLSVSFSRKKSFSNEKDLIKKNSNEYLIKQRSLHSNGQSVSSIFNENVVMHAKNIARIVVMNSRPNSGLNDDANKAADLWNNVISNDDIYDEHATALTRNKTSNENCLVKIPQASFSETKADYDEKSYLKSDRDRRMEKKLSEKTENDVKVTITKNKNHGNLGEDRSDNGASFPENLRKEKTPNEVKAKNKTDIYKETQQFTETNVPPNKERYDSKFQENKKTLIQQNNIEKKPNKIKIKKILKKSKGIKQNIKATKTKKLKSEQIEEKVFMGDMNEIKDLEKPDFSSQEMYDDTNLVPENNSDTISFKKELETQVQKISERSDLVKIDNDNSSNPGSLISASESDLKSDDYEYVKVDDNYEESLKEMYDTKQDKILTERILKQHKGFNPPPEKSFSIQKNLTEEELLAINNAKEEAKIRLKLANEERKTKRALAAEKRKHDVERKRREKEDKKLKEADEERRREIMRKQLEEERMQREVEQRRKKEAAELERLKLLEEEENKNRKAHQLAERERRMEEERRKKREELIRIRKEEEKKRKEQQRLLEEEEAERKRLEEEMLEQMAEEDRLAYIEKMRKQREERDREELARRLYAEEQARKAMDFAKKQAILKAHEQALLQKKFEFLNNIKDEDERMLQAHKLSRAFNFSYFELLKLLGIDYSKPKGKNVKEH